MPILKIAGLLCKIAGWFLAVWFIYALIVSTLSCALPKHVSEQKKPSLSKRCFMEGMHLDPTMPA